MVLINASRNEGALLMDAAVDEAETEVITASYNYSIAARLLTLLAKSNSPSTHGTRLQRCSDRNGRWRREHGHIIQNRHQRKSTSFQSEVLNYSADDGPLDNWLESLNYNLYNQPESQQAQTPSHQSAAMRAASRQVCLQQIQSLINQLNKMMGQHFDRSRSEQHN